MKSTIFINIVYLKKKGEKSKRFCFNKNGKIK